MVFSTDALTSSRSSSSAIATGLFARADRRIVLRREHPVAGDLAKEIGLRSRRRCLPQKLSRELESLEAAIPVAGMPEHRREHELCLSRRLRVTRSEQRFVSRLEHPLPALDVSQRRPVAEEELRALRIVGPELERSLVKGCRRR
jgi:hypothetical protein